MIIKSHPRAKFGTLRADFGGEPTGIEPPGYDFSAYRGGDLFKATLDIQGKPEYKTKFS